MHGDSNAGLNGRFNDFEKQLHVFGWPAHVESLPEEQGQPTAWPHIAFNSDHAQFKRAAERTGP